MNVPDTPAAVGIFDSGIGGLTVLRAVRALLPCHPIIYLADQGHVPYGARSKDEIRGFAEGITRFLLDQGARVVVVACNAASAAALYHLRAIFPDLPFVGMEPAIKPAAAETHSGVIGVLATPITFQGDLYASAVARFARDVTVLQDTCPGLVKQIESGQLDTPETRHILERALLPMVENGVDTVVMGCTHYPFVFPLIQEIVGPQVHVIDPSPAVARQVFRQLESRDVLQASCPQQAPVRFYTTGDPYRLIEMLPTLLGERHVVEYAVWESGILQ